jgi:hypothetical protein
MQIIIEYISLFAAIATIIGGIAAYMSLEPLCNSLINNAIDNLYKITTDIDKAHFISRLHTRRLLSMLIIIDGYLNHWLISRIVSKHYIFICKTELHNINRVLFTKTRSWYGDPIMSTNTVLGENINILKRIFDVLGKNGVKYDPELHNGDKQFTDNDIYKIQQFKRYALLINNCTNLHNTI